MGDRYSNDDTGGHALLSTQLKRPRLIRIYIGEDANAEPFHVQQSLLEAASDYFVKAFKYEAWGKDKQHAELHFPDHDREAWEVLLYWVIRREQPGRTMMNEGMLAVKCWILGDYLCMPEFQDEAMLALLVHADGYFFDQEAYEEVAANTAPGSPLRTLLLEEAFVAEYRGNDRFWKDMTTLGEMGFANELQGITYGGDWCDFRSRQLNSDDDVEERYGWYLLCGLHEDHKLVRWLMENTCSDLTDSD